MQNEETLSFESLVSDIISNEKYNELKKEYHHGINRYSHSVRVAKVTYKISKKLKMDYKSATRGAMLHDFFKNEEYGNVKGLTTAKVHPHIACYNAKQEFSINEIEADVISSHMFPLNPQKPSYKESWLVNYVDEAVGLYEFSKFKFAQQITLWTLFILNMIIFGQK